MKPPKADGQAPPGDAAPPPATIDLASISGGWMLVTSDYAATLAPGIARTYLYQHGDRWYRSPCTTVAWSWLSGVELTGSYAYFDGSTAGAITCVGSPTEKPMWGVGCSNGPGPTAKVLPYYSNNSILGQSEICQDIPDAFGGPVCQLGVDIYTSEGCAP
jgi:hypothetical protein